MRSGTFALTVNSHRRITQKNGIVLIHNSHLTLIYLPFYPMSLFKTIMLFWTGLATLNKSTVNHIILSEVVEK